MTLRLDAGAAAKIAGLHELAATTVDDSAASMPDAVDGGLATAYLSEVIAAVATTAAELAVISTTVAGQVRDVADDLGLTEDVIAEHWRSMSEDLR